MRDNIDEIDLISLKIIEKNTLKKSVREANERKEDLAKVLHRVENIYGEFEKPLPFTREFSTIFLGNKKSNNSTNIEMVEDVPTLEQMLVSHQSREKYLQQVTVFIVGYSKVAQDRLRLMQEVNQFFLKSEDLFDSYIAREGKILNDGTEDGLSDNNDSATMALEDDEPEYTVSELSESMQQSLDACQSLTNRLGELNNEIIDCFAKFAQNKAGNKGKKKLEKSLENAVSETNKLNEKLAQTYKIISEKDSRIDSLVKQCEAKSKEVLKFKAAADSIRKAAMESDSLRQQLKDRDGRLMKLESELIQSQIKIDEVKTVDAAQRANAEEMAKEFKEKSLYLEKTLELQKIEFEEMKREMSRQHSAQLKQIQAQFDEKLQQVDTRHEQETKQLKSSEFDENAIAVHMSESENELEKPLTKSLSSISKNDEEKKAPSSKGPSRVGSGAERESRQHTNIGSGRSSGKDVWSFDDAPDLDEEDFWSNIPRNHLIGRFAQYRQMSRVARSTLQDDIESANNVTSRQIHSLKSQHQALKHRWDEERENLIEALRKTEAERKETQVYADTALEEMEKFLSFVKSDEHAVESSSVDVSSMNMLEIVECIRDYLIKQNLLKDPISSMISTLVSKFQIFQERTRISLPRFSTTIGSGKFRNNKPEVTEKNSQTDFVSKVVDSYAVLDENRDIMLPEESDGEETATRDVAISASPALLKLVLRNFVDNATMDTQLDGEGISKSDLEVPSNFVDIEDISGLQLIQHPIVVDYLHSYDHVLTFKENFVALMEDTETVEGSKIVQLRELKPISIRSQLRIIPQIEEIGKSIDIILYKCAELIEGFVLPKKQNKLRSKMKVKDDPYQITMTTGKQIVTTKSKTTSTAYLNYVTGECYQMRQQLKSMKQSFVLKFNGVNNAMTKMSLLLATLAKQNIKVDKDTVTEKVVTEKDNNIGEHEVNQRSVPDVDSLSILFTRKDSERNIRRMQEAMLESRIGTIIYEEAVAKMAEYVEIPAKRLLVLVRKYVYTASMKKISEYVRQHNQFDAETFKILDKMEDFQEKKIRRYDEIQEYFRNERILRAQAMIDTFDKIQTNSSIFLIRPVLSKSSRNLLDQLIQCKDIVKESNRLKKVFQRNTRATKYAKRPVILPATSKDSMTDATVTNGNMWMPPCDHIEVEFIPGVSLIESKLFEIDTNRMLLPMNNVSMNYSNTDISDGQRALPPSVAVRSYVAVAHPTLVDMNTSPRHTSSSNVIVNAPDSASKSRLSKDLSKHAPLPPITPTLRDADVLSINDDIVDYINES